MAAVRVARNKKGEARTEEILLFSSASDPAFFGRCFSSERFQPQHQA
jgi:hypothetical protein